MTDNLKEKAAAKGGKPEIWFERMFLWGAHPVHWKGLVTLLVTVFVFVGVGNGAEWLVKHGWSQEIENYAVIFSLVWFVGMWIFMQRHTGPRGSASSTPKDWLPQITDLEPESKDAKAKDD